MYIYVCIGVGMCILACVYMWHEYVYGVVYVCVRSWVGLHVAAVQTRLVRSGLIIGDSGSCRCGTDTIGIRRPMHRMIRRSVPVHAVKTRRRFGSETSSFQVSVSSSFSLLLSDCSYYFICYV